MLLILLSMVIACVIWRWFTLWLSREMADIGLNIIREVRDDAWDAINISGHRPITCDDAAVVAWCDLVLSGAPFSRPAIAQGQTFHRLRRGVLCMSMERPCMIVSFHRRGRTWTSSSRA